MRKKFELNKLYKVRFYDHCVGSQNKMTCQVVGWIIKDEDDFIVTTSWIVDTEDAQIKKDNVETTVILKKVMISARKYS
jgi:hypothetical protein